MFCGKMHLSVISAENLPPSIDEGYLPSRASLPQLHCYVKIEVDGEKIGQTVTIQNTIRPEWNEKFSDIELNNGEMELSLVVYHSTVGGMEDRLAECKLDIQHLVEAACRKEMRLCQKLQPSGTLVIDLLFEEALENVQLKRQEKVKKMYPHKGHKFMAKSLAVPVFCSHDKEFIWGLGNQALTCNSCSMTIHKSCLKKILSQCPGVSLPTVAEAVPIKAGIKHTFKVKSYWRPTFCNHCGSMLLGFFRQGYQCSVGQCQFNCHEACREAVPPFCGTNTKILAAILETIKKKKEQKEKELSAMNDILPMEGPQEPDMLSMSSLSRKSTKRISSKHSSKVKPLSLKDFTLKTTLGKGAFGKVILAEKISTKELFAIKVVEKEVIIEGDDVEITQLERNILALGWECRFLTCLHAAFQTTERLFYVMEFLGGGDLMHHMIQCRRFSEERSKFYTAEIVLALQFLHNKGCIYRDLKLDNIMLTVAGHVKLADFGMCKKDISDTNMTNTFCGTPNYIAPEILDGDYYGDSVDWWALGILLYEMLYGRSPYMHHNENELFRMIRQDPLKFPSNRSASDKAKQLISGLLVKDPFSRLGTGNGGERVKSDPFFHDINWNKLERGEVSPPFVPTVKSVSDTNNFDTEFTTEKPELSEIQLQPSMAVQCRNGFPGFSFNHK